MSESPVVRHIDGFDLRFSTKVWPFSVERRADIDAFFADLLKQKPAMWNGRALVLNGYTIEDGVLRGECLETDYASFTAWSHWGWPAKDVNDCFGAAAMISADGACLLGVMGDHTFNAGHIYLPCGTPDPRDVRDGKLDIEYSVARELKEETGFDISEFTAEPGWTLVTHHALVALIKVLRSNQNAVDLRDRILKFNAGEKEPELADIRIVRSTADFESDMREFVKAFMAQRFTTG
jgi:8-oxo-dGTP pyrophosphatase MutT (NUDIX family)